MDQRYQGATAGIQVKQTELNRTVFTAVKNLQAREGWRAIKGKVVPMNRANYEKTMSETRRIFGLQERLLYRSRTAVENLC